MRRQGNHKKNYSSDSTEMDVISINSTKSTPTPPIQPLGRRFRATSEETAMTDDEWVKTSRRTTQSVSPEPRERAVMYVPVENAPMRENFDDNETIASRETINDFDEYNGYNSQNSSPAPILAQYLADREKSLTNIVSPAASPAPDEKQPVNIISPRPAHLKHRLNNGHRHNHNPQ